MSYKQVKSYMLSKWGCFWLKIIIIFIEGYFFSFLNKTQNANIVKYLIVHILVNRNSIFGDFWRLSQSKVTIFSNIFVVISDFWLWKSLNMVKYIISVYQNLQFMTNGDHFMAINWSGIIELVYLYLLFLIFLVHLTF